MTPKNFRALLMMILALGLNLSLLSPHVAQAEDAPDFAKEERLHQVFKRYNEQPTSDELWKANLSKVQSQGQSQNYQIQKMDTLWDLSETFFGDPKYWPKIWSLNGDDVLNPHEILPGQQVHFTEGTFGEPPTLAVKEGMPEEPLSAPIGQQEVASSSVIPESKAVYPDGNVSESELPPAKVVGTKVSTLPSSLPDWEALNGLPNFKMHFDTAPKAATRIEKPLDFFISEKPQESEGFISETSEGTNAASDRQLVYVKFKQAPTRTRYVVIEVLGEVADPWQKKEGRITQVLGEIELINLVNPAKNIYRARSTQLISHFLVGSLVVAGEIAYINSGTEQESAPIASHIIGGSYDQKRNLFGPEEIVFLNSGANKGISPGQSFAIYKSQKARNPDSEVEVNPPVIGRLKVVKVTEEFSTAIVTDASDEIRVGDSLDSANDNPKSE